MEKKTENKAVNLDLASIPSDTVVTQNPVRDVSQEISVDCTEIKSDAGLTDDSDTTIDEQKDLSQQEAKVLLQQLTNVFSSVLGAEDSRTNDSVSDVRQNISERKAACEATSLVDHEKRIENQNHLPTSHEEKAKLDKIFSMWKASKDPNCSPALPHIVTILMYTSSLYYPLRSHSLDFCLFRCLAYSPTVKELEGDYEIWWKICDLLPNECSMTRTCLKMCKVDVSSTATCAKFEGTAKSPIFYLYSALFQLHIADKGRFADQKSYFNKRWWEENYKPALFAADEALKLMKEDDYSLHRLLTYIISYCRAVILVLMPTRNGKCHLCDDYTTLAASHIVPHFLLRKVPKPMCFYYGNSCALQDDVKKYALCGSKSKKLLSCEALFGEWETRFSKVYSDLQSKGSTSYTFKYEEWLPLFAYSVAWRLLLLANARAESANYQHPDWFNNVKISLANFITQPSVHTYPVDVLGLPWMFMTRYEDIPVHLEGPMINQIMHLTCGGPILQQVGSSEFIFVQLMEVLFLFPITDNPVVPESWKPFRLNVNGIAQSIAYVDLPVEVKYFVKETYSREVLANRVGTNLKIKWKASASVNAATERWLNKPPVWVLTPCAAQFSFMEQRFMVYTPFSLCNQIFSLNSDSFMCVLQLCKEKDTHILLMAHVEKQEPYSTVLLALLLPLPTHERWCKEKLKVYPSPRITDCVTAQKEVMEFLQEDTDLGSEIDKVLANWQQACMNS